MKYEEWLDFIDDEYLTEAIEYTPAKQTSYLHRHFRMIAASAAALFLVMSVTLIVVMTSKQNTIVEDNPKTDASVSEVSDNISEIIQVTPIMVYLSGENVSEGYAAMNRNQAVSLNSVYDPKVGTTADGIRFKITLKGYRIDATADNGHFLPGKGYGYQNAETTNDDYYDSSKYTYAFDYDSLSVTWRPDGKDSFWNQESDIRIYAMRDNVMYMYAVVHIASKDSVTFTTEVVRYEDYTLSGGVVITDENSSLYYPLSTGSAVMKTCDINEVITGQKPNYTTLRVMQPYSMKIPDDDTIYHDIRNRIIYGIPFVFEDERYRCDILNSNFVKYDPDLTLSLDEIYKYLEENNQSWYYTALGAEDKLSGMFVPGGNGRYPEIDGSGEAYTMVIYGISEQEMRVYGMAHILLYRNPYRFKDNDFSESIILIREYKDYTDIGGIEYNYETIKGFPDSPVEDRAKNVIDIVRNLTAEDFEKIIKEDAVGAEHFKPESFILNMKEKEFSQEFIAGFLEKYPYLDDKTIAELAVLNSSFAERYVYFISTYPRLENILIGSTNAAAPRMTKEQAFTVIDEIKNKIAGGEYNGDFQTAYSVDEDLVKAFEKVSGGADTYFNDQGSARNSISPDPPVYTYYLADGGTLSLYTDLNYSVPDIYAVYTSSDGQKEQRVGIAHFEENRLGSQTDEYSYTYTVTVPDE